MTEAVEKKPVCFVVMPIADVTGYDTGHFSRVYEHMLKPAIVAAGYHPVRADDAVKTDYIVVGIIQKIVESEMVICDFSARNPNVMYELGIRHAFNKPVVLIKDRRTEKIFDIQGLRHIEYDDSLRIDTVAKDIGKITASLEETANGHPNSVNSVVQLANIKTAEVPVTQEISPDTQLILSALGDLERRIQNVEDLPVVGVKNLAVLQETGIILPKGDLVAIGEEIYEHGRSVGTLTVVSPKQGMFVVRKKSGAATAYSASSAAIQNFDTLPF